MKKTDKIIGIDLGTTNSCVSVMEGKNYKVIDNAEGNATTPSIIAIREKEVLVGQAAKQQAITNSENTFFAIKRLIGRRYNDPQIKEIRKYVPYNIVEAKNGDAWVVDKVTGKQYPPSQISSMILSKMKKTAEEYLGAEVHRAVITVPAYFNNEQRKATIEAGKIAKLKVERIINEPTAAALAYGLDREKNKKIVVYDLGGGTFDVSILELSDDVFEVLSTTGNTYLGGEDFDLRILNYLADAFQKEHNIDLRKDKMALQRLKEAAEKAKIELSTAVETEINLPFITANQDGPKHLNMKITRAKLEHLVEDLIKKTVAPCLNALKDAGLEVSDIDDVIPVGGMTRMPKVQEQIRSLFKKEPHKGVNPDEVVAIGAAIQGAIISGDVKDLLLLDACSLSLGIETVGGKFTVLIKRNTTLPTVKSQIFSTAQDNQESVAVKVYQGERPIAADNNLLGIFQLHGIRPAPRGLPQIQVTFDVNHDGTISVSAEDLGTKQKQSINVAAQQGLNQDEIDKMIKASEANAEEDATRIRIIDTKNEVDHLIYSTNKLLDQYKDKIDKDVKEDIQKDIDELKKLMNKSDIKLPELQEGLEKLKQSSIKLSDVIKQHAATNQQDSAQSAQPEDAHSESDQGHQDYQSGSESHQSTENNRQGKDSKPEDVIDVEFEENKK